MKRNSDITGHARIIGYDLARAFALLYIVIINFWAMVHSTISEEVNSIFLKIQGRGAVLFVVLAGGAISLISKQIYKDNDYSKKSALRIKLLKRALFLFILGFLNTSIWLADILHFYAIFILISFLTSL